MSWVEVIEQVSKVKVSKNIPIWDREVWKSVEEFLDNEERLRYSSSSLNIFVVVVVLFNF